MVGMDLLSILLLGLVQGVTEWVPVSSKTQDTLVYLSVLHGNPSLVVPILLYLHLGTFFAAILYFRTDLRDMLKEFREKPLDVRAHLQGRPGFLFTALFFTGIVGIPILLLEKRYLASMDAGILFAVMGIGLVVTGIFLLTHRKPRLRGVGEATWRDGVLTGLLQGLSTLPGISRSGTSTSGLIWRGFDSEASFHLSFLLSIPTVLLAEMVFYIGGSLFALPPSDGLLLALVSFVFGYLTIDAVLRIVKRVNLAYVALGMGIIIIIVGLVGAG